MAAMTIRAGPGKGCRLQGQRGHSTDSRYRSQRSSSEASHRNTENPTTS
jgi:hypothetical protein